MFYGSKKNEGIKKDIVVYFLSKEPNGLDDSYIPTNSKLPCLLIIHLKLLQTKKTRASYAFIKVYLYEQIEKRSGFMPLRVCIINQVIVFSFRQILPVL